MPSRSNRNESKTQNEPAILQQQVFIVNPAHTNACEISLGGLIQLSSLEDVHQFLYPYTKDGGPYWHYGSPATFPTGQPAAYPLIHATIHTALLL